MKPNDSCDKLPGLWRFGPAAGLWLVSRNGRSESGYLKASDNRVFRQSESAGRSILRRVGRSCAEPEGCSFPMRVSYQNQ
jgi:hypothetical protein